ncbi:primosomal protein N' (replication factor Y) - superfamily II helicase [Celeribacter ethanolicus]|uniref:Primosomal protein N' (Replication factor Y)-superfamily II helicase n=1 Tax=Celeribacter ethanolicus TaxID=1758178 RepID=A0A291GGZ0_9RHOB|nr:primosomal protein N' (replication factor Y) - superfamily II helicase [Celeribacter ethanolicus]ATG49465.1 primosomal protein N' (replication factor Y) - superfamily II helicase [Celeribacter ethanolicus]
MENQSVTAAEEHRFPCHTCGADLRFAPDTRMLVCDHCGAREEIESGQAPRPRELDFHMAVSGGLSSHGDLLEADQTEEIRTSTCPNCGAVLQFDDTVHATECPYCATPVVTDTGHRRQIKPQGVLPFAVPEETAQAALKHWLGSLWFAPNALKKYARKGRRLNGVYMPYWTFDTQTQSRYSGERGTDYHESVMVNGQRQTRRRTRWRHVSGQVKRFFDDVLVVASTALPLQYVRGLAPWDLSGLEPYLPDYLAGYTSEAYTFTLEEGFQDAQTQMARIITRDIKFDIGGDRQRIHSVDTRYSEVTYKHILLPVWFAAYKFRGKTYRFVINGRTGQVQGERPYSAWKIAFAVLLGLIAAGVIGYVYALQNQGGY